VQHPNIRFRCIRLRLSRCFALRAPTSVAVDAVAAAFVAVMHRVHILNATKATHAHPHTPAL